MKIESSNVAMIGESAKLQMAATTTQVVSGTGTATQKVSTVVAEQNEESEQGAKAGVSKEGRKFLTTMKYYPAQETSRSSYELPEKKDYRIELLERMLEILSGKRFKFRRFNEKINQGQTRDVSPMTFGIPVRNGGAVIKNDSNQLFIQTKTEYYEKESMSFSMKAHVKTSDGKTIDVELSLSMSREFYAANTETFNAVRKDPLVINFDAPSAALSSTKFAFDIDCDGTPDQISQLMAGSGYLAVDWDGSGTIKDGSQLFGTQSGDGFKDLAKYDTSGNGWIDEDDEIFDKLRIWAKDEAGNDYLFALGEKGIGAIYLGSVASAFELKDGADTNGFIQRTGFFLREDGTAGTVQHVDLVV